MTKPWKVNEIGHILLRYCLIKQAVQEKREEKERRGRRLQQLLDDNVVEIETGSTSSTAVDNSLWKRLWIRRNADYVTNKLQAIFVSSSYTECPVHI